MGDVHRELSLLSMLQVAAGYLMLRMMVTTSCMTVEKLMKSLSLSFLIRIMEAVIPISRCCEH